MQPCKQGSASRILSQCKLTYAPNPLDAHSCPPAEQLRQQGSQALPFGPAPPVGLNGDCSAYRSQAGCQPGSQAPHVGVRRQG